VKSDPGYAARFKEEPVAVLLEAGAPVEGMTDILRETGFGEDEVSGDDGNDTLKLADKFADTATCGAGNDTAVLDMVDVITDATAASPNGSCEQVIRKAPKASDSKTEDAQQAPAEEKVAS
jgi:hypothetical protein